MIPLQDDNPSTIKPLVTIAFVAACVLVFLWQFSLGPVRGQQIIYALGVIPAVLLGQAELPPQLVLVPPAMTTLTSMFMHGGWMHLIGNMLYLWIFGDNVEDSMGHGRFVVLMMRLGRVEPDRRERLRPVQLFARRQGKALVLRRRNAALDL